MQISPLSCVSELTFKTIRLAISSSPSHWVGDGFYVKPIFNELAFTNDISPFLMFDYAKPKQFNPSNQRRGVGDHPHKGFETVTIAFEGEVEHGDSAGNRGVIGPGDVQWMTAGKGIVHQEYLSESFSKKGGVLEMAQLWVNLPAAHKLTTPKYQPILKSAIPVVELLDGSGKARIIAGNLDGIAGAASTFTNINMWDVELLSGKSFDFTIPEGDNTLIFVRTGSAKLFGEKVLNAEKIVVLSQKGSRIHIEAESQSNCCLLILSGTPINEPIAARGPFVMNTEAELRQAMREYQTGVF